VTQEFHLSVTLVGQNDYLVRTEQVAPGVPLAEELVSWPVDDWLTAASHLMNDPLQSVLQGDGIAINSVNLVALGKQLYNKLFQGTLRDSWITAQGIAQNHQEVLRLRLGFKDPTIARLPWEVMHAGDRPIATGPDIAFSRYQSGMSGVSRLPTTSMPAPADNGGIRVLMVISSPTDQARLDLLKQEAIKLQEELHQIAPRFGEAGNFVQEIDLTLLEQPGREELTQALEQGRFHILHYSGHSNVGPRGGEIYLVSRRTGLTETLCGDDLAGLLVNNNIQIAVFNSCLGAYTAGGNHGGAWGERNLTESLVKRGIKGVLAMSERIPDEVALTLTQLFYRNLAVGYPVDLCVSRMRQGLISAYGSHQMYWALPILYLQREFDGYLNSETYLPPTGQFYQEYDSTFGATATIFSTGTDDVDITHGVVDDLVPSSLTRDPWELDWWGEDGWGDLADEIEQEDSSYAEDSAIVSDLFGQLDRYESFHDPAQPYKQASQVGEDPGDSSPKLNLSQKKTDNVLGEQLQQQKRHSSDDKTAVTKDGQNSLPLSAPETSPQSLNVGQKANDSLSKSTKAPSASSLPGNTRKQRLQQRFWWRIAILGASALAAAVGFLWWWKSQQQSKLVQVPLVATTSFQPHQKSSRRNLASEETAIVTAYAMEKLSKGDLQNGLFAVEELLNRNALSHAKSALALVPNQQIDNSFVNFLRGRLAWQFVQTGDKNYSVDDARRYWENAVKAEPDSLLYSNALGFAYYAQGNLDRANDSWFKALNAAIKQQNTSNTARVTNTQLHQDTLTAYAGLAIGLYKSARNQPDSKQQRYINEAIKLRQMVLKEDAINFQPQKLANDWLWPEEAIADWKSLLELPSSPSWQQLGNR